MPRLSILVPKLSGEDREFEDTLASILRNLPNDCEVLALHDGSYPDPHNLREVGVQLLPVRGATQRGELLAGALSHCRAEVLHILRPGVTVEEGWTAEALAPFADPRVAAAVPVLVPESQQDRILTWGLTVGLGGAPQLVGSRHRFPAATDRPLPSLGPTLWAAFYRRHSLQAILRRFAGRLTQLLDLELGLAIRSVGWNSIPLASSWVAVADPDRVIAEYRGADGRDIQHLLARHWQDGPFTLFSTGLASGLKDVLTSWGEAGRARRGLQRLRAAFARFDRELEQGYLAELRASELEQHSEPPQSQPVRRAA